MSRENMEIVRAVHDGWARGDVGIGADLIAPDFEWHQFAEAVEPGTRRGAEVGTALRTMFDVYENLRVEPVEFIDAGDKIVVIGRAHATARGSGMPLDMPFALVWTLRDGRLVRNEFFTDRNEALEAAGLGE